VYSGTQNNGRITQSIDGITGENVSYAYDALNRLIAASTADNTWGNVYTYDGFGNLTGKTVTKGSAPSLAVVWCRRGRSAPLSKNAQQL
jgi:YD repeat-containing protein